MTALARHPFATAITLAVAGAAAAFLALILVVLPAARTAASLPADLGHAYVSYFNGVGEQFRQARQQDGGTP